MSPTPELKLGRRDVTSNLSALAKAQPGESYQQILLDQLHIQPGFNPRGRVNPQAFSAESLADLRRSLREDGLLQPLLVRPQSGRPGHFWIIAGERRYRSAVLNAEEDRALGQPVKHSTLGALVRDVNDETALELAIIENAQRLDVDLIEESLVGIQMLQQRTGFSVEELRAYLTVVRKNPDADTFQVDTFLRRVYGTGVSVWSQQRIQVLELSPAERAAVAEGRLPFKAALVLLRAPSPLREELLGKAIQDQLSVEQLRALLPPPKRNDLQRQVHDVRKALPKIGKLKGEEATRANQLLAELLTLLR